MNVYNTSLFRMRRILSNAEVQQHEYALKDDRWRDAALQLVDRGINGAEWILVVPGYELWAKVKE